MCVGDSLHSGVVVWAGQEGLGVTSLCRAGNKPPAHGHSLLFQPALSHPPSLLPISIGVRQAWGGGVMATYCVAERKKHFLYYYHLLQTPPF